MITAESIATSVHTLAQEKNTTDLAEGLLAYLHRHSAQALLPRIVQSLERLYEKDAQGKVVLAGDQSSAEAALTAAARLGIDTKGMSAKIDPTLIGGYIVAHKGQQVDTSYKSALLGMYRAAVARV